MRNFDVHGPAGSEALTFMVAGSSAKPSRLLGTGHAIDVNVVVVVDSKIGENLFGVNAGRYFFMKIYVFDSNSTIFIENLVGNL